MTHRKDKISRIIIFHYLFFSLLTDFHLIFVAPTPTGFAVSDSDKSKFSCVMFELFLIEYTVGRGLGSWYCLQYSHSPCLSILLLRLFYFSGSGATLSDVLRFASGFTHRRLKH